MKCTHLEKCGQGFCVTWFAIWVFHRGIKQRIARAASGQSLKCIICPKSKAGLVPPPLSAVCLTSTLGVRRPITVPGDAALLPRGVRGVGLAKVWNWNLQTKPKRKRRRKVHGRVTAGYSALADGETRDPVFGSRIDTRQTCRAACADNTVDRSVTWSPLRGPGGMHHRRRRLSVLSLGPARGLLSTLWR